MGQDAEARARGCRHHRRLPRHATARARTPRRRRQRRVRRGGRDGCVVHSQASRRRTKLDHDGIIRRGARARHRRKRRDHRGRHRRGGHRRRRRRRQAGISRDRDHGRGRRGLGCSRRR